MSQDAREVIQMIEVLLPLCCLEEGEGRPGKAT